VMLLQSYEYLNETGSKHVQALFRMLNKTGREVCEGQQLDMDFEKKEFITLDQYLHMIELKTAVFLAACLRMGAIIADASEDNQENIYAFGKNLGLAFQVQDDWLDSFGNPSTFGKQKGGDILSNKKTFLLVHALENAGPSEKKQIQKMLQSDSTGKVELMIGIFRATGADRAAEEAKMKYMEKAGLHLERITVPAANKIALKDLAQYLMEREI